MKLKIERYWATDKASVKIQVQSNGKWYDFGEMNFIERKELADQLREIARELEKVQ